MQKEFFDKHYNITFNKFKKKVEHGNAKINTKTLQVIDIVGKIITDLNLLSTNNFEIKLL